MKYPRTNSGSFWKQPDCTGPVAVIMLCALLSGCGNPQESARKELAKLGKDFSPASFIESVGNDDKHAVRLFIEAGIDVNASVDRGFSALAVAALNGNQDLVGTLLSKGANPNAAVTSGKEKGSTPLMAAAMGGHLAVIKLLLDKGAEVNAKDVHGLTALDYASAQTNFDVLEVLWTHGAPLVTDAAVTKLMDQFRSDLRTKTVRSMVAGDSTDGCLQFITEQLRNFHDQGFTTNQLLEARVCAFRTVSDVVQKSVMDESVNASGAIGASEKNRLINQAFVGFLKELQSDPHVQAAALIRSAELGEAGMVKWILDQGADVNSKDDQGFTPLIWASFKGQGTTIRVLLDAGANVNAKTVDGWTATMWAASQGRNDALKLLLSTKPDLSVRTSDGKTALMIAEALNQAGAVVLLKNAGATD